MLSRWCLVNRSQQYMTVGEGVEEAEVAAGSVSEEADKVEHRRSHEMRCSAGSSP